MFERMRMAWLDWKRVGAVMGLLLGLVLLLFLGLDGGWFFGCVVREVTGWSCPGCGGLRAIAAALGGDWFRSLSLNALALPLGLLAGYSLASVVLREVFGCCWFRLPRSKVFWICLSLVVVGFGVLRNWPGFPFPLED